MHSEAQNKLFTSPRKDILLQVLVAGVALVVGAIMPILPSKLLVLTLALPLLLGYSVLAFTRFDLAVFAIISLAPMIPPSLGLELSASLPLITSQRILLLILYVVLMLQIASRRLSLKLPRAVWLALIVYVGANILSGMFAELSLKSLYRILAHLFDNIGLLLLIVFTGASRTDKKFVQKGLILLWASLAFLALMGLIDTLTGFSPLYYLPAARRDTFEPLYRLGVQRGQGLLPHTTALAVAAAIGIVLTFLIITWQKHPFKRIGLWLTAIMYTGTLVGTMTRTGWFVLVAGGTLWLFLARRLRVQLILLVVVVIIFLVTTDVGDVVYSVVESGFDLSQQNEVATLRVRIRWPAIVWANLTAKPQRLLFGFGPGSASFLSTLWGTSGVSGPFNNSYLIILAESGLVGLLSLVGLFIVSIGQAWRLLQSPNEWVRGTGVFFLTMLVQVMLASLVLPLFSWVQTTSMFWILLGLLLSVHSLEASCDKRLYDLVK